MNNIDNIKSLLLTANEAYRKGKPILTDIAFDEYLERYRQEFGEDAYSEIRVKLFDPSGKIKHPFTMGSLEKLKAEEPLNVNKWLEKRNIHDLFVSAKVDGMSCRLSFDKNGTLIEAATRGDGLYGQNILNKIKTSGCIKDVKVPFSCDIRGELVIKENDLKELNEIGIATYKNARNAIVGIMGKKDATYIELQYISFIAYELMNTSFMKTYQFKCLNDYGFEIPLYNIISVNDKENITECLIKSYENIKNNSTYIIDGLVICDKAYTWENEYLPERMRAFKVNDLIGETTLLDISWEGPSKSGKFIPIALLDPIELGGASIGRASCYNAEWVKTNKLKYGQRVIIEKAGDIIPRIREILKSDIDDTKLTEVTFSTYCPSCNNKLHWDGVDLKCINKYKCPEQIIQKVNQFMRRLGVENASLKTLKKLNIWTYDDLIQWRPDSSSKSQTAFYNELITKIFNSSKEKILGAIDFEDIAEKTFDKIINSFTFDKIITFTKSSIIPTIPDVGEKTLQKLLEDIEMNVKIMNMFISDERYNSSEVIQDISRNESNGILKGKSFCFTGSLHSMSRKEAQTKVEFLGGENKSGVTKGLTYLVTNDTNSGSSKNRKAKELNVIVINEKEFIQLLNDQTDNVSLNDL